MADVINWTERTEIDDQVIITYYISFDKRKEVVWLERWPMDYDDDK